jgi:hypothetical protein
MSKSTVASRRQRMQFGGDRSGAASTGRGRRLTGQDGYVLAMTALLILPLMVFTAFAVDLGSWYADASRMQRAADAAALAAVVRLPDVSSTTGAVRAYTDVARANGYENGVNGVTVTGGLAPGSQTRYRVSITGPGRQYFSFTFDTDGQTIARSATAEFNRPVPLGSPNNAMGNDPTTCPNFQPSSSCTGAVPYLWSAIQAPYSRFQDGDPYMTKCSGNTTTVSTCRVPANPNGAQNSLYKPEGYKYAVEVPPSAVGSVVTLQIWDAAHITRTTDAPNNRSGTFDCKRSSSPFSGYSAAIWSDFGTSNCQTGDSAQTRAPLQVRVYENDNVELTTPLLLPGPNNLACERYWDTGTTVNGTGGLANKNAWQTVCTFTATRAGAYPVTVKTSNIVRPNGTVITDVGTGWNAYSLRATVGGAAAGLKLYALDDLSIWTNTPGSTSRFYLAEIKAEHRGKKILLDLYDPGDGSGGSADYYMSVKAPPSGLQTIPGAGTTIPTPGVADSCNFNSSPSATKGPATPTAAPNCRIRTRAGSSNIYNGQWLRVEIQLSPTYSCSADCWWSIAYDFSGSSLPTDRTTWSLQVVGDPVHLVE